MSFDTFANLQTEISAFIQRGTAFDASIPSWIALAEASISKDLRVWRMESLESLTVTAATATVALPSRLRDIRWVKLNGESERLLTHLPAASFYELYSQADGATPVHFTTSEGNLLLGPTPTADATLYALCILAPQPLSISNPTNAILESYPDVYFYGALFHAFQFLRNTERLQFAAEAYNTAIEKANKESRNRKMMATPTATRTIARGRVV